MTTYIKLLTSQAKHLIECDALNKETALRKDQATLQDIFPKVYDELVTTYKKLEKHYRDMQDIEFTVQKGKLFILQTRSGINSRMLWPNNACLRLFS